MKLVWFILAFIPTPFLFHFFEYGYHVKRKESAFLLLTIMLIVFITGALSGRIKIRYIILVNVITGILSLLLSIYIIPDDGSWFKPLGRDLVILITAIGFFIVQLMIRLLTRLLFMTEEN